MCKRLLIVLLSLMVLHLFASVYVVLSAEGERMRHLEYLGRRLGLEELSREGERKDQRFTAALHHEIHDQVSDVRWWNYKLIVKEGVRFRDVGGDTVVGVFVPTQSLPWWCWFKGPEQCLVLHADCSVYAVSSANVPFIL